jgi:hypothetical protein
MLALSMRSNAQHEANTPSKIALQYADSLLSAYRLQNWNSYIEISYPGLITYFGGRKGFEKYLERSWQITPVAEEPVRTELYQLINEAEEWQCVIKKTSRAVIDGRKAQIINYLIGQSRDAGKSWQYVDLAFASTRNLPAIMPDVFNQLKVPDRNIIFEVPEVAHNLD